MKDSGFESACLPELHSQNRFRRLSFLLEMVFSARGRRTRGSPLMIGIIEGEQTNGKKNRNKKIRNDRLVAVEEGNHSWAAIKHIDDLGKSFVRELEEFFVNSTN